MPKRNYPSRLVFPKSRIQNKISDLNLEIKFLIRKVEFGFVYSVKVKLSLSSNIITQFETISFYIYSEIDCFNSILLTSKYEDIK